MRTQNRQIFLPLLAPLLPPAPEAPFALLGLILGEVAIGLWLGSLARLLASAMALGLAAYGISLVLFVIGLRHLGTARTGAYFSVAPFFGAVLAVAGWGEPVTPALLAA